MSLPRRLVVEFVAPDAMRVPSVGDWQIDGDTLRLTLVGAVDPTADGGRGRYDPWLVAVHELVEWLLCHAAGVSQAAVDAFDEWFDAQPASYRDLVEDEAGDDPTAPYHRQHQIAMQVEFLLAQQLGMGWHAYERRLIDALAAVRLEREVP